MALINMQQFVIALALLPSTALGHLCVWSPMQRGDFSIATPGEHYCYRKVFFKNLLVACLFSFCQHDPYHTSKLCCKHKTPIFKYRLDHAEANLQEPL
jgi:hypothetical protein